MSGFAVGAGVRMPDNPLARQTCRGVRLATCMPDVARIPLHLPVGRCRWSPKLAAEVRQTQAGHAGAWQRGCPQYSGRERRRQLPRTHAASWQNESGEARGTRSTKHTKQKGQSTRSSLVPRCSSLCFVVLRCASVRPGNCASCSFSVRECVGAVRG
jgi:hypothetical protein